MTFFKKLKDKITQQTDSVSGKFKDGLSKTRGNFPEKSTKWLLAIVKSTKISLKN